MADQIIVCGNTCGHDHEGVNSPTGCCPEHGPYMYFCGLTHPSTSPTDSVSAVRSVPLTPEARERRQRRLADLSKPPGSAERP